MSAWRCVHRGAQGLRADWPEAQGQVRAAALEAAALWRDEHSTPSGHEQTARSAGIRGGAQHDNTWKCGTLGGYTAA